MGFTDSVTQSPFDHDNGKGAYGSGAVPSRYEHALSEEQDERVRLWALLSHMTALSAFAGIPFGNIMAPLIIWIWKRRAHPFIKAHCRESLNFQISMSLYIVLSFILCLALIGFVLLAALCIADIVLIVIASLKADKGAVYRYPMTLRMIRSHQYEK